MLILPRSLAYPEKHPKWSGNYTPNVAYQKDRTYRETVDTWCASKRIGGPGKTFEVRIVKSSSKLDVPHTANWWNNPLFMEKIFWVYQKPLSVKHKNDYVQLYCLEFFENIRVRVMAERELGYNPWEEEVPSLCVPSECVELCWEDTVGGQSAHCRDKFDPDPTQEEIEKEDQLMEIAKGIQKNLVDVSNDDSWKVKGDPGNIN